MGLQRQNPSDDPEEELQKKLSNDQVEFESENPAEDGVTGQREAADRRKQHQSTINKIKRTQRQSPMRRSLPQQMIKKQNSTEMKEEIIHLNRKTLLQILSKLQKPILITRISEDQSLDKPMTSPTTTLRVRIRIASILNLIVDGEHI